MHQATLRYLPESGIIHIQCCNNIICDKQCTQLLFSILITLAVPYYVKSDADCAHQLPE